MEYIHHKVNGFNPLISRRVLNVPIGQRIKAIREISGLTQDAFAKALSVKPSKVRDVEAGRQRVNDEFVSQLVEIFPVDLNWLFDENSEELTPPPRPPMNENRPFPPDASIDGVEYSALRVFELQAGAGNGILPTTERTTDQVAFTRQWLMQHGVAPDLAGLIQVRGDSMAPTIPDRAYVLVDFRARGEAVRPGVYVLRHDGEMKVKRLDVAEDGSWISILSDNPSYPPLMVVSRDPVDFAIIGRVRAVVASIV